MFTTAIYHSFHTKDERRNYFHQQNKFNTILRPWQIDFWCAALSFVWLCLIPHCNFHLLSPCYPAEVFYLYLSNRFLPLSPLHPAEVCVFLFVFVFFSRHLLPQRFLYLFLYSCHVPQKSFCLTRVFNRDLPVEPLVLYKFIPNSSDKILRGK